MAAGALYGVFGLKLSPMFAAAAMSLSSVCVVGNALRLKRFRAEALKEQAEAPNAPTEPADDRTEPADNLAMCGGAEAPRNQAETAGGPNAPTQSAETAGGPNAPTQPAETAGGPVAACPAIRTADAAKACPASKAQAGPIPAGNPASHKISEPAEKSAELINKTGGITMKMKVEGMSCSHCSGRVEKALNALEGVEAKVDLESGVAHIQLSKDVDESVLRKAVVDAGYEVAAVEA